MKILRTACLGSNFTGSYKKKSVKKVIEAGINCSLLIFHITGSNYPENKIRPK